MSDPYEVVQSIDMRPEKERWRFRTRRLVQSQLRENDWVGAAGEPEQFEFYANAALKAFKDSVWYSESIIIIEDRILYPVAAYANGILVYCWNQAPPN